MLVRLVLTAFSNRSSTTQAIRLCSKIPSSPVITFEKNDTPKVNLDSKTIALLERLSLVKCDNKEGVKVLEDSIAFADKILHINTDNIEPLYSVLENE